MGGCSTREGIQPKSVGGAAHNSLCFPQFGWAELWHTTGLLGWRAGGVASGVPQSCRLHQNKAPWVASATPTTPSALRPGRCLVISTSAVRPPLRVDVHRTSRDTSRLIPTASTTALPPAPGSPMVGKSADHVDPPRSRRRRRSGGAIHFHDGRKIAPLNQSHDSASVHTT
jgi:hypothetical protein